MKNERSSKVMVGVGAVWWVFSLISWMVVFNGGSWLGVGAFWLAAVGLLAGPALLIIGGKQLAQRKSDKKNMKDAAAIERRQKLLAGKSSARLGIAGTIVATVGAVMLWCLMSITGYEVIMWLIILVSLAILWVILLLMELITLFQSDKNKKAKSALVVNLGVFVCAIIIPAIVMILISISKAK